VDRIAREYYALQRTGDACATTRELAAKRATSTPASTNPSLLTCVGARPGAGGRAIQGVVVFVVDAQQRADIPKSSLEQLATLITLRAESVGGQPDTVSTT
jgi:hypothetical protein